MIPSADFSQRLLSTFLVELEEHARAIERDCLALERGEGAPAQLHASLLRSGHSLKGAARVIGLDAVEATCHRFEEVVQAMRDGVLPPTRPLFQLLLGVADALSASGHLLAAQKPNAATPLMAVLPGLAAAVEGGIEERTEPHAPPLASLMPTAAIVQEPTLRVAARKLDTLLAQDGELLVARRRAASHTQKLETLLTGAREALREGNAAKGLHTLTRALQGFAGDFAEDSKVLDQAAEKLSTEIRLVRMLPFAQACEGLDRLVRDLTANGEKDVVLALSGGDIGVDRSVLEGLRDPLMHLVRNAVDHGIESKQHRHAAGKSRQGRISVSASLVGPQLVVSVRDDGQGIDSTAITEKMKKRGHTPAPAHEAIFQPGFSTQDKVSRISGRGVGLDVVKSQIEDMRGVIRVESTGGKGATFTLSLPLTLTSIRGLLVRAGGQTFALDSTMVRALRRVPPQDIRLVEGRAVLVGEGEPLPFCDLASLLSLAPMRRIEGAPLHVVLLGADVAQAAIAVDALLEEDDLTVRNLGPRFGRLPNISGGTILCDGRVALILHATDLIAGALEGKAASTVIAPKIATAPKKRLLIAEDSMTTRTLIKAILENAGYEVDAAQDGAEAFRLLEDKGADLVVADVEMPQMDGFTLTTIIRGSARHSTIPVILLTALETDRDKARGLSAGANAYLVKSAFDQRELISTIQQMV